MSSPLSQPWPAAPCSTSPAQLGLAVGAELAVGPAPKGARLRSHPSAPPTPVPSLPPSWSCSQGCLPKLGLSLLGWLSRRACHGTTPACSPEAWWLGSQREAQEGVSPGPPEAWRSTAKDILSPSSQSKEILRSQACALRGSTPSGKTRQIEPGENNSKVLLTLGLRLRCRIRSSPHPPLPRAFLGWGHCPNSELGPNIARLGDPAQVAETFQASVLTTEK